MSSSTQHKPTRLEAPNPEQSKESSPTALAKLLDHARQIGITVEDYQEGPDRRIWVYIAEAPDNHSRKIIRKLIDFGFIRWPGKGFWR